MELAGQLLSFMSAEQNPVCFRVGSGLLSGAIIVSLFVDLQKSSGIYVRVYSIYYGRNCFT